MDKKQEIINEYLLGRCSYRQLSKKHGIGSTTLHGWVQSFLGIKPIKRVAKNVIILPVMKPTDKEILPKEIEALQQQLAQEKLRNKLLSAMIEIAETELKIPIRKKYGTRQLKK